MRLSIILVALAFSSCKKNDSKEKEEAKTAEIKDTAKPSDIKPPLPVAAPPADAVKVPGDISYKIVKEGEGTPSKKNDSMKVHYSWWKTDGTLIRSSVKLNRPQTFHLGQQPEGWQNILTGMKKGETRMAWVPFEGLNKSKRSMPGQKTAVISAEVLEITPAPPALSVVSPAGATAINGLTKKTVTAGTAKGFANSYDKVKFTGKGWDAQGNQFFVKTDKAPRLLTGLPEALSLAVQSVSKGESAQVWIPKEKNADKKFPDGDLVFELTVDDIIEGMKPPETPSDVATPPADAKKTADGVSYKFLSKQNAGDKPGPADTVKVDYTGWTTDGKMFDSSITRGQKASFPLNRVIKGWTEGLQVMSIGDKVRFWIPEQLAYQGKPGMPAGMLVFDVELFEIKKAPKPPEVPTDVAAPPKDAKKTDLGVSYKVLKEASQSGGKNPGPTDKVTVHYSGWTTDGKMFDSSVMRGSPATFGLNQVIKGWTDGLQTMVVGQKTRFWIPEKLAYGGSPGKPAGMLVFDVELLGIK